MAAVAWGLKRAVVHRRVMPLSARSYHMLPKAMELFVVQRPVLPPVLLSAPSARSSPTAAARRRTVEQTVRQQLPMGLQQLPMGRPVELTVRLWALQL